MSRKAMHAKNIFNDIIYNYFNNIIYRESEDFIFRYWGKRYEK